MTRTLVALMSYLSASTTSALPAVQVQNYRPSFRSLMDRRLNIGIVIKFYIDPHFTSKTYFD